MNQADLLGEIPVAILTEALDDNGDGTADEAAWAAVVSAAEERLHSAFGGDVPPRHAAAATRARKLFALVILYNRRGFTGEANPYTTAANLAEKRLEALAAGEVTTDGGNTDPVFVGQPAKIAGVRGNLA